MVSEILKVEGRMKQNHEAMAREVASVKSSQEASIGQVEAKVDELGGQMTEMKALLTQLLAEAHAPPATL
jgi:phage shock protein A